MSSSDRPITITGLDAGASSFSPPSEPADETEGAADAPEGPMSVRGEPCPGQEGDATGVVGCEEGAEITGINGCGLWPDYAEPVRSGIYTVPVTWRLSTLCADTSFAPCRGLIPEPTQRKPVIATWSVTAPYCVEVRSGGSQYQVIGCP